MVGRIRQFARRHNFIPTPQGAFWVFLGPAVPRVFGPIFTIVLRRFIGPAPSGIFDTASVPYRFLDNFRNFGTGPALVFQRRVAPAVADTAWTLNMLLAIAVTAIANVLAHPIAVYFGHPRIEGVFRILSFGYIFASAGSVHFYLLMRNLDFRARTVPALGQVVIAGTVAVVFAAWGFGVGTLVARELTSVAAGAVLLWAVCPYRPRIRLQLHVAWALLRYGGWIGAGLSLLYMSQNVDVFIGAKMIKRTSDVGFYTTSWRLAFILAGVFTTVSSGMIFPFLSRIQEDTAELRTMLVRALRLVSLSVFPGAGLLATLAPVVIVPLLGEKWAAYRASAAVLSLLAVYAGNRTLLAIFFEGYKSVGKPWIVPVYNLIKLGIMVPLMVVGASHGITGLALAYIPVQVIEIPAGILLAWRVLGIAPTAVWRAIRVPLCGAVLMSATVLVTEVLVKHSVGSGDLPALAFALPTGVLIYIAAVFLLDRGVMRDAFTVLLRGL